MRERVRAQISGERSDLRAELEALEGRRGVRRVESEGVTEGFRVAVRLVKVFTGLVAVVLFYSIWAAWFAGSALPPTSVSLRVEGALATGTVTVPLAKEMSLVRVQLAVRAHTWAEFELSTEVCDPKGVVVFHHRSTHSGDRKTPGRVVESTWGIGLFDVKESGAYRFTLSVTPGKNGGGLESAELQLRGNSRDAHFFRNGFFVLGAAVVAGWWWKRRYAPPVGSDSAPGSGEPEAWSRADRDAITYSPVERFLRRAALEGLSLLLSAARVPILGAYGMIVSIAGFALFGGFSPNSLEAALASPHVVRVLGWLLPQGEHHGWAALFAMGQSAGTVVLIFHLVTLPLRWLLSARRKPTFGQKAKRFLWLNLGFLGVLALGFPWVKLQTGVEYWDALGIFTLMTSIVFVPALVLLGISTAIEHAIDRLDPNGAADADGSGSTGAQ